MKDLCADSFPQKSSWDLQIPETWICKSPKQRFANLPSKFLYSRHCILYSAAIQKVSLSLILKIIILILSLGNRFIWLSRLVL